MEDYQPGYERIVQFIEGKARPDDAVKVLAWINSNNDNRELYFQIKDIVDYYAAQNKSVDTPKKWERTLALINEGQDGLQQEQPPKRLYRSFIKYAAALLVIAAGSFSYYQFGKTSKPIEFLVQVPVQEHARYILLPDSSEVWVKGGGSLRYNEDAKSGERSVWLNGTGFFKIRKRKDEKQQPLQFVVHTEKATVTVLGTSFTVDEGQQKTSVIVNTGLVKASTNNKEILLHPSDRLQTDGNTLKQDRVNAGLFAAWKDGDYQFDKTSINELESLIETIYNYEVTIYHPQKLKAKKISGRITISDEATLWKALSLMLQADVTKRDHRIIIRPK